MTGINKKFLPKHDNDFGRNVPNDFSEDQCLIYNGQLNNGFD
jgi:hypothetical protein